jgi:hypothetical protein
MFWFRFFGFLVLGFSLSATAATATAPASELSHPGPILTAYVQRGEERLPIFLVDHLHKGDKLSVTTNKAEKGDGTWLLVLATIAPITNKVDAQSFDLSEHADAAAIDITADDQVPIIVLAPQVRTMFGLHTSFSESATLIVEAIKSDPQRFVDLQKIDQIDYAVAVLASALDAVIQSQKSEQAMAAVKALAAKFGVKYIDPACFKDSAVNTKCVAISIVSSKDMTVPSSDDLWSSSGPNSSGAKIPTDISASLKVVTEASTYLVNKYGDNYDFAPSSGHRQEGGDHIQLIANARFKSGDVKTAYVYVASWFTGKQPEVAVAGKLPACLVKGELIASVKGLLPLKNYWHDWKLVLHEPGTATVAGRFNALEFKPENGEYAFDFKKGGQDLPMEGELLDATLEGKFGFADAIVAPFKVTVSSNDHLLDRVSGLDSLVAGEHAKLRFGGIDGNTCIEQLAVAADGKTLASSSADARSELSIDFGKIDPGPATLEIRQYGVAPQELPIVVKKRKAHIQRMVHFDLETDVTADGDNLERIDSILAGHDVCHAINDAGAAAASTSTTTSTSTTRVFACPAEIAANANFPAQVTIRHLEQEPASFDFPVTKIGARPHMTIDGANAAIVTILSAKGLQWNLNSDDQLVTEDSGLGILLHAFGGYRLSHGPYVLQLKFADDPQTEQTPISVPLMSDLSHNELRTRTPVSFANAQLPSVVNPILYRVQHLPTGLVGDWQSLNRSVVYFPQLGSVSCGANGSGFLIHGNQLELIDWASNDLTRTSSTQQSDTSQNASMTRCDKGLCLGIGALGTGNKLRLKVHWIDDRLFDVSFPDVLKCVVAK